MNTLVVKARSARILYYTWWGSGGIGKL